MIQGTTEIETLKLNGWGVGDILEGEEYGKTDRIKIIALGNTVFICQWDYNCLGVWGRESGNTTLTQRKWVKVGPEFNPLLSFCKMHHDEVIEGGSPFGPAGLGSLCKAFVWSRRESESYQVPNSGAVVGEEKPSWDEVSPTFVLTKTEQKCGPFNLFVLI